MAKEKSITKIANIFTKYQNPLRNLNNIQIEHMLSQSLLGNDVKLQIAYMMMERSEPIFNVCLQKRIAGVNERNWDIVPVGDSDKAREQAKLVKGMFELSDTRNEDGLTYAIRHLCTATFRGRAGTKAFIDQDGHLLFKNLNNWNFLYLNGKPYWNPDANLVCDFNKNTDLEMMQQGIIPLPQDEVCYVLEDNPVDWSGLGIYLRCLIANDQWSRCVEKYGIPPVILEIPEGVPETDLEKFGYRAQAIFEGGSGAVPHGTVPHYSTEPRGQDPFTSFLEAQQRYISMLATGGTALTIGDTGGGIGSDLVAEQKKQFDSLVTFDCKRISNAITYSVVSKCVRHLFGKDSDVLCRFEFTEQTNTTPQEYLDLALKVQQLGITIDVSKLKEISGLEWIKDDQDSVWKPESTIEKI